MWDEIVDFGDRAFHRRPFRRVVIAVRMMRQKGHHRQKCTNCCKLQGFDQHGRPPYVNIIIAKSSSRLNAGEAVTVREISTLRNIPSCNNLYSERPFLLHQEIGAIVETVQALAPLSELSPRKYKDACYAGGWPRRSGMHQD